MKKEIIECHKDTSVWIGSSLWDKNKSGLIGYNKKTNKMVYKKDNNKTNKMVYKKDNNKTNKTNKMVYKKDNNKTWYEAKNQSLIIKKLLDYLDFESGNMNDRKIKEILIKNNSIKNKLKKTTKKKKNKYKKTKKKFILF